MQRVHDRHNRGKTDISWLKSYHTFSFGGFQDPNRMGVSSLRVINEDYVIPGAGFQPHGHQDMEILTYVVSGALSHKDSLGNGATILPGEIQIMSAGTGIRHSEMNASRTDSVHFFQIWIEPDTQGLPPGYQQITLKDEVGRSRFDLIAGRRAGEQTVKLNQDAGVYLARPLAGTSISLNLASNRKGFLQIVKGRVQIEGETLFQSDGVELTGDQVLEIESLTDAEMIFFDLKA